MRALARCAMVSMVIMCASVAHAEQGTVHLKDGGRVHGEIMEVIPGQYVSVMLADGEVRRFAWSEVERVGEGPSPVPSPEPPPESHPELQTIFGLKLGTTKDALAAACSQRGFTWSDAERPTCSGTAKDLGAAISARFKMCDERTCTAVVSIAPPEGGWKQTYASVRTALLAAHGPSKDSTLDVSGCHGDVGACFAQGKVKAQAHWRMPNGDRVDVQLRLADGAPRDIAVWYGLGRGAAAAGVAQPAPAPTAAPATPGQTVAIVEPQPAPPVAAVDSGFEIGPLLYTQVGIGFSSASEEFGDFTGVAFALPVGIYGIQLAPWFGLGACLAFTPWYAPDAEQFVLGGFGGVGVVLTPHEIVDFDVVIGAGGTGVEGIFGGYGPALSFAATLNLVRDVVTLGPSLRLTVLPYTDSRDDYSVSAVWVSPIFGMAFTYR